ncbi:MAG: translation elongation factor Ts [Clostridia bacterium]|nr:translation elongation factor Ts [Clostridia bacterium]
MFSAQDVKELREMTGCGMMDCKKALAEANGDKDKAVEILREKGLAAAAKKSGRIAAEGIVKAYISDDGKTGVLVEVNSETDFVAKNAEFQTFVSDIARHIAALAPSSVEELLGQKFFENDAVTISDMLTEKIAKIGENMSIRRFERFEGNVFSYIHGEGRIGVLVQFDTDVAQKAEFADFAKDIAMQIAAAFPQYLDKAQVPAEVVEKEKEILRVQALNEGKPEAIVDKMVMGRINKFYKEVCLLDQEFIKDQDMSVSKYIEDSAKKMGGKISIVKYARFEKGEGLQKKEENFADEVANMIK